MSLETLKAELEQYRRSLAMLPTGAPLSRESAMTESREVVGFRG